MISIQPITNIIPHPNADKLNLLNLGGYQFISNKEMNYQLGDLVLTIPEEHDVSAHLSVLQEPFKLKDDGIIRRMSLRGSISQGIIISSDLLLKMGFNINELPIGTDLCETLNIPEYIKPIPEELLEVIESYRHPLLHFHDCVYPAASNIAIGDNVEITEKLHGTQINILIDNTITNKVYVSSKGLLKSKFVFQQGVDNIYTRCANKLIKENPWFTGGTNYIQIVGEVIPAQKGYSYGFTEPRILLFGLYVNGQYTNYREFFSHEDCVPLVYTGPLKEEHFTYDDKVNRYSLIDGNTLCEGYCITDGKNKTIKVKSPKFLSKNAGAA
jgi:RNA ligase (TIGR02306 family)